MRVLLKEGKQREFLKEAIVLSRGLRPFLKLISTKNSTLKGWRYSGYLIPKEKFDSIIHMYPELKCYNGFIIKIKPDSWGKIKGGKRTYKIIVERYGIDEIRKRQSNGIKSSALKRGENPATLNLNYENKEFLEFYGALLGDGWMSSFTSRRYNKTYWQLGLSMHIQHDKEYLIRIKRIVKELFNREGYLKYKPKHNSIEFIFGHKELIKKLNEELGFPVGVKINLSIARRFLDNKDSMRHIIRGLFDTDGSIYFDRDKNYRTPYPIIDICTYSNTLIEQLNEALKKENFKVIKYKKGIRIKGHSQVQRWFRDISPQNKKHKLKYQNYLNHKRPE